VNKHRATSDHPAVGEQLFDLSEYQDAERRLISDLMRALPRFKSPLLGAIRHEEGEYVGTNRTTLPEGGIVESPPFGVQAELSLSVPGAIEGDAAGFFEAIDQAADQMTAGIMKGVLDGLDRTLEAAGQTVDASGRPLSWDVVLDVFEKMDWDFDEAGQPKPKTLFAGPAAAAKFEALPPPTPEQEARYLELMERKRREDLARRGTRKLSR
jgi:hypothetical protein